MGPHGGRDASRPPYRWQLNPFSTRRDNQLSCPNPFDRHATFNEVGMADPTDKMAEQLAAAKEMLRQLEESLAKTQRLIEQTRQILNQDSESGTNATSKDKGKPA